FHWVHATIFESVHTMCLRFVRPLSAAESEQLYREFRQIGRLYGLRERDMPADLASFWIYYDRMLRERIEDNPVLREVLDQINRPPAPPWLKLPRPMWSIIRWPIGKVQRLLTIGTLPPIVRERWQLHFTTADERALDALGFALREGARAVPFMLRYQP